MRKQSSHPIPRLKADALTLASQAAGMAPACLFESSQEWHEAAVERWREVNRRKRLSILPSLSSLGLAVVLVVL